MSELLILIGLPGSGKTHYAKTLMTSQPEKNWFRMNWDEFRESMGIFTFRHNEENAMQELSRQGVKEWLLNGRNVIIDNTNLSEKTRNRWHEVARLANARSYEFRMNTDHETCVIQDAQREGKAQVGRAVIDRMALFAGGIPWDYSRKIVIFDMDGTLADSSDRTKYVQTKPKDWNRFFNEVDQDKPVSIIKDWVDAIAMETNHYIVIVSGRPIDQCGKKTVKWLQDWRIPYDYIFMRQSKDYKDDTIVKKEILDKMPRDMILFAVDDRPRIVRMWKENGITCYPVGSGEEF